MFCVYETGAARQGALAAIHRFMFSLHTTFAFRMRSSGVFECLFSHALLRTQWLAVIERARFNSRWHPPVRLHAAAQPDGRSTGAKR